MRPFLFLVTAVFSLSIPAQAVEFSSGNRHVALIELFTSEGCSSCPPAESWLAQLAHDPRLWHDFVPVALHVDYWNRLGWRDSFSSPAITQRQYDYAHAWQSASVYTPCFVRDGAEWKWPRTPEPSTESSGILHVVYEAGQMTATFTSNRGTDLSDLEVHGALLAGGIESEVKGGENGGKTLRHEFVATTLISGGVDKSLSLPVPVSVKGRRLALAVWVTRKGSPAVLQATGGWLEP